MYRYSLGSLVDNGNEREINVVPSDGSSVWKITQSGKIYFKIDGHYFFLFKEDIETKTSEGSTPVVAKNNAQIKIETKYGDLPNGYSYMDEFYMDENNNKIFHGRRVNSYPGGRRKMECFYQHGVLNGCVEYDEIGNVTSDTRTEQTQPNTQNEVAPVIVPEKIESIKDGEIPNGTWVVVLGSFKTEAEASTLLDKCKNSNIKVELLKTNDFEKLTKDYYFVCGGKGLDKESARKIEKEIKASGFEVYTKDAGSIQQ
jgi:hypothetical protein